MDFIFAEINRGTDDKNELKFKFNETVLKLDFSGTKRHLNHDIVLVLRMTETLNQVHSITIRIMI